MITKIVCSGCKRSFGLNGSMEVVLKTIAHAAPSERFEVDGDRITCPLCVDKNRPAPPPRPAPAPIPRGGNRTAIASPAVIPMPVRRVRLPPPPQPKPSSAAPPYEETPGIPGSAKTIFVSEE